MRKFKISLLPIVCLLLWTACSEPEAPLTLNHGVIYSDFHQSKIGQITFLQKYIPFEQYTENDLIETAILGVDRHLFMRVFLEHTQTYYLTELAPELTPNQLCKKGNWQDAFKIEIGND